MIKILVRIGIFLLFLYSDYVHTQIKINSNGKVGLGGWSGSNNYEIRGNRSYFSNAYNYYNRTSYSYVYEAAGIGASHSSEYTLIVNPVSSVQNVLHISDAHNRSRGHTLYVNGDAVSTRGWYTYSDKRMKKRERKIERQNILSKLTKIRGKRYEYKTEEELMAMHNAGLAHFPVDTIYKTQRIVDKDGKRIRVPTEEIERIMVDVPKFNGGDRYGVVAQEVMAEYPELVSLDESSGMYTVDYQGFIPLLLEGFSLQQEEMTLMRRRMNKLNKRIEVLEGKGK